MDVVKISDPALGRFASADTLVPGMGNPQAWDRYAYALNNALRYSDPTGHEAEEPPDPDEPESNWNFFEWTTEQQNAKLSKYLQDQGFIVINQ